MGLCKTDTDNEQSLLDIKSPADGVIYRLLPYADKSTFGNQVLIKHTDGKISLFAHVEKYAPGLKEGDKVSQGQKVATAGNTSIDKTMPTHGHWTVLDGVKDGLHGKTGSDAVFVGKFWALNSKLAINPQDEVDSGNMIHPMSGKISSPFGKRDMPKPYDNHWGQDYSVRYKRE